jgi:hypothetical protein
MRTSWPSSVRVAALKVGPATDPASQIGPMINARAIAKIDQHVRDAIGRGARVITGGKRLQGPGFESDNYYAPTVLANVTGEMQCSCEETFGPVAPTRFATEEEVIAAANATPFGLAAYFYSTDVRRIHRVTDALESGIVGVNEGALAAEAAPSAASRNPVMAAKARCMAWMTTCTPNTFARASSEPSPALLSLSLKPTGAPMPALSNHQPETAREPLPDLLLRPIATDDLGHCHRLSLRFKWPHRLEDWNFLLQMGQGYLLENTASDAPLRTVGSVVCTTMASTTPSSACCWCRPSCSGAAWDGGSCSTPPARSMAAASSSTRRRPACRSTSNWVSCSRMCCTSSRDPRRNRCWSRCHRASACGRWARMMHRLLQLDAQATGMDRSKLLLALLEISEGVALDRDGEMLGFALVRRFGHGRVIGPVVAPDAERAKGLIAHWINTYSDSFIRIDVFESSGLPAWFDKLGLTCVDHVTRMCKGEPPVRDAGMQLFSIVNQALG